MKKIVSLILVAVMSFSVYVVGFSAENVIKKWDFNTNDDFEGWSAEAHLTGTVANGCASLRTAGDYSPFFSPWLHSYSYNMVDIQKINFRLKNIDAASQKVYVYFINSLDADFIGSKVFNFTIAGGGDFVDVSIPTSTISNWSGTLKRLRIDPKNLDIDSISLVGADIPLGITSITPVDKTMGVAINLSPAIAFSEAISAATVTNANVVCTDVRTGAILDYSLSLSSDEKTITVALSTPLSYGGKYNITVNGIISKSGTPLSNVYSTTFTTLDKADNSLNTVAKWDFNDNTLQGWIREGALSATVANGIVTLTSTGGYGPFWSQDPATYNITNADLIKFRIKNNTAVARVNMNIYFTTTASQSLGEDKKFSYTLPVTNGFIDVLVPTKNNSLWTGTSKRIRFDPGSGVAGSVDVDSIEILDTNLAIIDSEPNNNFDNFKVSDAVKIAFNQQIDQTTLTDDKIKVRKSGSLVEIPFTKEISSDGKIINLSFATPFDFSTKYEVLLSGTIKDIYGNSLPENSKIEFTTQNIVTADYAIPQVARGNITVNGIITNNLSKEQGTTFLVGLYRNGALCDVTFDEKLLTADETGNFSASVTVPNDGALTEYSIRAYVWESMMTLRPLK